MSPSARYALVVLCVLNTLNFFDRQVIGAVGEAVRREWSLGDTALGGLGTAFTLLFAAVGLPLGRWSDRTGSRTKLLMAGVVVWSLLTIASGLARSYWQLFVARLGMGVGEATCAPVATSMIGDLVPARYRARALSIFMLGLPIGISLGYGVGGFVSQHYGWRAAFYVAGAPGLVCALALLLVREPARGVSEAFAIGSRRRPGSPYRIILSIPTVRWLIVAGVLHTFTMYALGTFLASFLIRAYGMNLGEAGWTSMLIFGVSGIGGLLAGGAAADAMYGRRKDGRLIVGAGFLLVAAPCTFLALAQPPADAWRFALWMAVGCSATYAFYSSVYPTMHDVIEPGLRATGTAVLLLAIYVLGAALGPVGTGMLSDSFTQRAAAAAGVYADTAVALEPFRALGLGAALQLIPVLLAIVAVLLIAASRTVTRDADRLQAWMRTTATDAT